MDALVVGGTRILRPAVLRLVAGGAEVGVVARRVGELLALARASGEGTGGVIPLAADYLVERDLLAVVDAAGGYREAILYLPLAPASTVEALVARTTERAVVIRTTSEVAPGHFASEIQAPTATGRPAAVLQLGWRAAVGGQTAWHDPEEISLAALGLLRSEAQHRTLGCVRPWTERPG